MKLVLGILAVVGALAAALVPGCISLRTVHGGIETLAGRRPGFRDVIRQKLDRFVEILAQANRWDRSAA